MTIHPYINVYCGCRGQLEFPQPKFSHRNVDTCQNSHHVSSVEWWIRRTYVVLTMKIFECSRCWLPSPNVAKLRPVVRTREKPNRTSRKVPLPISKILFRRCNTYIILPTPCSSSLHPSSSTALLLFFLSVTTHGSKNISSLRSPLTNPIS